MRPIRGIDDPTRHVIVRAYKAAPSRKKIDVARAHNVSVSTICRWHELGYGKDGSGVPATPVNGRARESADDAILNVVAEGLRRRIITGQQADALLDLA